MSKILSIDSIAKQLNDLTYTDYFYRLMLIARSVFKWNNLPNGIDEKWIEKYLFSEGRCVFFKDKTLGFMVAKCSDDGILNPYDEPTRIRPVATHYTGKSLQNYEECVVIRNNDISFPTTSTIQLYAMRLAELSRTIDVNVNAMKTPVIVLCNEKQKNSLKRVMTMAKGNELAIYGDKNLELDTIKTLNVEAPIVFDKLQIQKHSIWNECMTFLGINNANMDKRERLVDDEVQANNEQVCISADVMLKAREQACEEINKLFGTNISVELRRDINATMDFVEGGVIDDIL